MRCRRWVSPHEQPIWMSPSGLNMPKSPKAAHTQDRKKFMCVLSKVQAQKSIRTERLYADDTPTAMSEAGLILVHLAETRRQDGRGVGAVIVAGFAIKDVDNDLYRTAAKLEHSNAWTRLASEAKRFATKKAALAEALEYVAEDSS